DGQGGRLGTRVDLEQDLGLDDHNLSFIGGVSYQFKRRHGFELMYFDLSRSAQRTLTTNIDFLDEVFAPQTVLASSLDTEIWQLSYEYAFLDQSRHRATAQVGLHYVRLSAHLGRSAGTRSATASADATPAVIGVAPLRSVNVFAGYNYYRMNVNISKRLWNGESNLDYQGPWVGFVVGFGGD